MKRVRIHNAFTIEIEGKNKLKECVEYLKGKNYSSQIIESYMYALGYGLKQIKEYL